MGKPLHIYASTISDNLERYKANLIRIIAEIAEYEDGTDWKPEWKYDLLSAEILALRNYLTICNETMDRIDKSDKKIASIRKKLVSLVECIKPEYIPLECLPQAKSLVKELVDIHL